MSQVNTQITDAPQVTGTEIRELRDLILGLNQKMETLDQKVGALDLKVEALDQKVEIAAARTDERFKSIDQRFNALETNISDMKTEFRDIRSEVKRQDNRLWGFIIALFFSLTGLLAKVAFFPPA